MNRNLVLLSLLLVLAAGSWAQTNTTASAPPMKDAAYLGFDRNDYPGDGNLAQLRKTFSYTSYWLSPPPGAQTTTWLGKRQILQAAGFGFLVVFNGRLYAQLKASRDIAALGAQDAAVAVRIARREGFPSGTIIFLDQEQGGRQLPEQKTYVYAFIDAVNRTGFGAGVYCSGIAFREPAWIVTAEDIRNTASGRKIAFWVSNDACGPSPGCSFSVPPPTPAHSPWRSPTSGNMPNRRAARHIRHNARTPMLRMGTAMLPACKQSRFTLT